MASLVIQSEEPIQAASFSKRVLIGRKPFNGVQFGQRIVSRIHAWIDNDGDSFFIRDARSRGGTFVNGTHTLGKTVLHDGDEIKIGTSTMTFHETDAIPDGAVTFHIADNGANPDFEDPGILIACSACGAPMWVPAGMAGAFGRCAICGGDIIVPGEPASGIRRPLTPNDSIVDMPAISQPVALGDFARPFDPLAADFPQPKPAASAARTCAVCQSPILPDDPATQCSSCSQVYHTECWRENHGCAAYGCPQVGALDEPATTAVPDLAVAAKTEFPPGPDYQLRPFPWDFALLGGSVLGSVFGAFTFGLPALVMGTLSLIYAMRRRDGNHRVATLSAVICLFGMAGGVIASSFIFNVPLWRSR
ncbi:MAG: FHA domain-containing protein [Tepidisphaeraceae bacterium]